MADLSGVGRHVARLALVLCTLGLSGCWWTQDGGSAARTYSNALERKLTAATVSKLQHVWTSDIPYARVMTWGNRVVAVSSLDARIRGIDAATGQEMWSKHLARTGLPAIRDGVLYVPYFIYGSWCGMGSCGQSSQSRVTAVSVADGQTRQDLSRTWPDDRLYGPLGSPAMSAEHEVIPMAWITFDGDRRPHPTSHLMVDGVPVGPSLEGSLDVSIDDAADRAYVVANSWDSGNPRFLSIALPGGSQVWERDDVSGPPAVEGDDVAGGFQVLDAETGADRWAAELSSHQSRALHAGSLYFGLEGSVHVYTDCGSPSCPPAWTGPGDGGMTMVATGGDVLYVAAQGTTSSQLRMYPAAGCGGRICQPLETLDLDGLVSSLAISNGQVYVSTSTGVQAFGLSPS